MVAALFYSLGLKCQKVEIKPKGTIYSKQKCEALLYIGAVFAKMWF